MMGITRESSALSCGLFNAPVTFSQTTMSRGRNAFQYIIQFKTKCTCKEPRAAVLHLSWSRFQPMRPSKRCFNWSKPHCRAASLTCMPKSCYLQRLVVAKSASQNGLFQGPLNAGCRLEGPATNALENPMGIFHSVCCVFKEPGHLAGHI